MQLRCEARTYVVMLFGALFGFPAAALGLDPQIFRTAAAALLAVLYKPQRHAPMLHTPSCVHKRLSSTLRVIQGIAIVHVD
jgi:hypothetical protein